MSSQNEVAIMPLLTIDLPYNKKWVFNIDLFNCALLSRTSDKNLVSNIKCTVDALTKIPPNEAR